MQEIPYDASHVPIDYDDPADTKEEKRVRREQRVTLEKDVAQLQKKLMVEVNMRNALNRGLSRPLGSLPRIYASLPVETRELLLEVAVLEEEILSLEKQVKHLGREIENEVPVTDKETICLTPHQFSSPRKANTSGSPSVSPKDSSRINSKPSVSPWKSSDQKSNLAKPSAGKIADNKSSLSKVPNSPRKSLDDGSSIKASIALKDSSKPARRITIVVPPQTSQTQRNGLQPKAPLRNSKDSKGRRLSFTKTESLGVSTSVANTVSSAPKDLSLPKDGDDNTPPVSPATGSPTGVGKGCPGPPRIKLENDKSPTTGHAQVRKKDPINDKVAPKARTPRQPGKDKCPVDIARRTPRLPLKHGTAVTRRTVGASTASREQTMDTLKPPSSPDAGSIPPSSSSNTLFELRDPVVPEIVEQDGNNSGMPSTDMHDGDKKPVHLSPDNVKGSEPTSSPETDTKLGLEEVTNSVLLSKEVVMLLKTIYGNLQEKQPPLPCDSGSSSQASMSASVSSASPDDYEMRGGVNIKLRMDGCHSESFTTKRNASIRFMGDCYPSEVADTLDPYSYLSRGNISNRIGFHERLMS